MPETRYTTAWGRRRPKPAAEAKQQASATVTLWIPFKKRNRGGEPVVGKTSPAASSGSPWFEFFHHARAVGYISGTQEGGGKTTPTASAWSPWLIFVASRESKWVRGTARGAGGNKSRSVCASRRLVVVPDVLFLLPNAIQHADVASRNHTGSRTVGRLDISGYRGGFEKVPLICPGVERGRTKAVAHAWLVLLRLTACCLVCQGFACQNIRTFFMSGRDGGQSVSQ